MNRMTSFKPKMGTKGQIGIPQILSLVVLLFVVFTVGKVLFNATLLDPESTDGGIYALNSQGGVSPGTPGTINSLTNIGFITMSGIILIGAMASIVIRFF